MSERSSREENMKSGKLPPLDKMLSLPWCPCADGSSPFTGSTVGHVFALPPLGWFSLAVT